ncbi:hypothetical protein WHR41_00988 [Cladosporium halotolerans]|uniref:DUF8035 domain-containing protein n=1 Tax=Cladosporium halotolerans TaxID=1052096 RepID=A0AB34L473_9PEZI
MSRRYADYEERDYVRSRYDEPELEVREARRPATVLSDRRTERPARQPDFLREDYGKSHAGPLVVREERREEDTWRPPARRRSNETVRSRHPADVEREIVIRERERERDRRPPYPTSERGGRDEEEIVYRERPRSQAPSRAPQSKEEIDIRIRHDDDHRVRSPPAKSHYARSEAPPRSEYHEKDIEEIRFRRGGGDRPPTRAPETDEIDIRIRERDQREREELDIRIREKEKREREEIDIRIRESERPAPRPRSHSRGVLVGKKEEEWIVRRPRSPSPPPPPRDHEREEIIIRRRERSPTPEPPREPTPPPAPAPPPEPIVRPPIIQEVIHHHRHIDHGIEPAREPTPPPPQPAPPSPPREDNLEIEIHRSGTRNGKHFDEDLIIEQDRHERSRSARRSEAPRQRSRSASTRHYRSPSAGPPARRRYDDDVAQEAEYYMRRAASRGYPGEAYDGATRDWGLVDVPPGTERVRMDGKGGGSQEITWQRYNGDRRSKFRTGDRVYEGEFGNPRSPPPAPLPPPPVAQPSREEEIRITETRIQEGTHKGKTKDKMWTEVTKDLVIKEAIDEMGYEYEETDDFFYVIEYLRYEDVLRLVELTEDIRRERRERIREIQWEREELERMPKMLPAPPVPAPAPPRSAYEERIYEKEYYYDTQGRRYRR